MIVKASRNEAPLQIHLVHVVEKRMIAQESNGLSRGDISEGMMKGEAMGAFIPLYQSALDHCSKLKG